MNKIKSGLILLIIIICSSLSSCIETSASPKNLLISGHYKDNTGNIYSPELVGDTLYFSGWYVQSSTDDSIYMMKNNVVTRVLNVYGTQLGDPSVHNDIMYMTYAQRENKQNIARSKYINGEWTVPEIIIYDCWLPSAVGDYVYFTKQDSDNTLYRMNVVTGEIIYTNFVKGKMKDKYPINVYVRKVDNEYWLAGDNIVNGIYSIGLWKSNDGIIFREYINPLIIPEGDNVIVRTSWFMKEKNIVTVLYAQQGTDWWTNNIYVAKYDIS